MVGCRACCLLSCGRVLPSVFLFVAIVVSLFDRWLFAIVFVVVLVCVCVYVSLLLSLAWLVVLSVLITALRDYCISGRIRFHLF